MKFTLKKKIIAGGVAAALAIGSSIAAYAYFTNNGSGTGSAAVGTSANITLVGTITGALYPAGTPAGVSVLVTNPGTGSQHVGSVHLATITTGATGCDTSVFPAVTAPQTVSAFTMGDITVNQTLVAGGTTTVTGSLQMNDTLVSQDTCKSAALTLNFTSN